MKNYLGFFFLSLFIIPSFSHAAMVVKSGYTRSPAGSNITSPVDFSYTTADPVATKDAGGSCTVGNFPLGNASVTKKRITFFDQNINYIAEYIYDTTPTEQSTGIYNFTGYAFNVGDKIGEVDINLWNPASGIYGCNYWLEYEDTFTGIPIFTIVAAMAGYFPVPATFATDVLAFVPTLVTDLWPIIALVIGIPVAFYIIRKIIAITRR